MTKAEIRLVRALADKRGREEHGLFVAEGAKLVAELRASHLRVRRIFAREGLFAGPEVETVSPQEMERLSLLKTPPTHWRWSKFPAAASIRPHSRGG